MSISTAIFVTARHASKGLTMNAAVPLLLDSWARSPASVSAGCCKMAAISLLQDHALYQYENRALQQPDREKVVAGLP